MCIGVKNLQSRPIRPKHHKRLAGKGVPPVCQLNRRYKNGLKLVQGHAHGYVGVLHHLGELLEADLAITVQVGLHDGLVHDLRQGLVGVRLHKSSFSVAYLLQLLVLQVAANHHLEHNEELAVADEAVAVNVVDAECEAQLLLLVAFAAEGREARDKLLEVDVATTILVEDGNHSCCERVRGDLGEG